MNSEEVNNSKDKGRILFVFFSLVGIVIGGMLGVRIEAHLAANKIERLTAETRNRHDELIERRKTEEQSLKREIANLKRKITLLQNKDTVGEVPNGMESLKRDDSLHKGIHDSGSAKQGFLGAQNWQSIIRQHPEFSRAEQEKLRAFAHEAYEYRESLSDTETEIMNQNVESLLEDVLTEVENRLGSLSPEQRKAVERSLRDPQQQDALIELAEISTAIMMKLNDEVQTRAAKLGEEHVSPHASQ